MPALIHGQIRTYRKHGCRCSECRGANAAYNVKYVRAARERRRKREGWTRLVRSCVECATDFNPRANQLTCSPACRKAYLGRFGHNATRAEFFGVEYEQIDRLEVFESFGWVCGICELPVDRQARFPDPGSPTLDHVQPMSQGGGHVRSNVQLAHFYCNTVKGNRMEEAC